MKSVFIGGCDRSGTTFLASMLGASEATIVTPESQFKVDFLYRENVFKTESIWRLKLWGIDKQVINTIYRNSSTRADFIEGLVSAYARTHGFKCDTEKVWVDHTPSNLMYANSLIQAFPESKFIHIIRDGRAVAASVLPLEWGPNDIVSCADWWLKKISHGLALNNFDSSRVLIVKYEDLIENSEEQLRRICNFVDISYCEKMLQGTGFTLPTYTQSQHKKVGKGISNKSLDSWKHKLSDREVEIFEYLTGDMLPLMGYKKTRQTHKKLSVTEAIRFNILTPLTVNVVNHIRRKIRIFRAKA